MNYFYIFMILFLIFTISAIAEKKKIVCIYQPYRRFDDGNFQVENIDPNLCTHLVYAYFGIDKITDEFISKDKGFDLDVDENGSGNMKKFNLLKHMNKNLLTIAAVGGWDENLSMKWSNIARNHNRRRTFIESSIKFIEKYGFNGIMLYWCFPGLNADQSVDKKNFAILLKEFKIEFGKRGLILGVAAHGVKNDADVSYDIPKISEYADFIYITGFDYYGFWLPDYTGISTALYSGKFAKDKERNVNSGITYWLNQGAAPEKLVLGVGLFGRTFTLKYENQTYPGAPHLGNGRAGSYTTEPGLMGYNEFCVRQMSPQIKWVLNWDDEQKVPYAYRGDQWIGYENIDSVTIKAKYVNEKELGGIGASFIEDDDFRGFCGRRYPLLNTMKSIVQTSDSDITYTINLSLFKKHSIFKNPRLMYYSSEGIKL